MPSFSFVGTNSEGQRVQGTLDAESVTKASFMLNNQKVTIIELTEQSGLKNPFANLMPSSTSAEHLMVLSAELATMLRAGLPLVQSLEVISQDLESPRLRRALADVTSEMRGGVALSESCSRHPQVFPDLFCQLLRVGERSGNLDLVLDRAARYYQDMETVRRKVVAALTYPAIIVSASLCVVLLLAFFAIPRLNEVYSQLGINLPPATQAFLGVITMATSHVALIVTVVVAAWAGFTMFTRTPRGRYMLDTVRLRLPILGNLYRRVAVSRFARTFSLLFAGGIPIVEALQISGRVSQNAVLERHVQQACEAVLRGESMVEPLKASGIFPRLAINMLEVGERTGSLETMLDQTADYFDRQVDIAVTSLIAIIEPLFLVFFGMALLAIVVMLFLPILNLPFQMQDQMEHQQQMLDKATGR